MTSFCCDPHPSTISLHSREVFAANLQAARRAAGLSARDLAHLTGLSVNKVNAIEGGTVKLTMNLLICLSNAVSVPIHRLFVPSGRFVVN